MTKAWNRNSTVGCLALLLVAGGIYYLASDPRAGERRESAVALRDECIRAGRAAFKARHRGSEMSPEQAGDLVGRCFSEAQTKAN